MRRIVRKRRPFRTIIRLILHSFHGVAETDLLYHSHAWTSMSDSRSRLFAQLLCRDSSVVVESSPSTMWRGFQDEPQNSMFWRFCWTEAYIFKATMVKFGGAD